MAVQMDGAGAALGHAAAEFGSRQAERVAQHPEKRRVGRHGNVVFLSVDLQLHGGLRSDGGRGRIVSRLVRGEELSKR